MPTFCTYANVIVMLLFFFRCFKVATPKRTFYLTGDTEEVVDDWLRGKNTVHFVSNRIVGIEGPF